MQSFPDAELGKAIMDLLNSIDENKDGYRKHIDRDTCDRAYSVAILMKNKYGQETNELRADREEREKILAMTPEKREWYFLRKNLQDVVDDYDDMDGSRRESMTKLKHYLETHPE